MKSDDKANSIIFSCPILKCHDVFSDILCVVFYIFQVHLLSTSTKWTIAFLLVPHKTKIIRKPQKSVCITEMVLSQETSYKMPQVTIYHLTHTLGAEVKNSRFSSLIANPEGRQGICLKENLKNLNFLSSFQTV